MNATRAKRDAESTPQMPQGTPASVGFGGSDHSFTLQAIMDLKQSFGELKVTMHGVKDSVDSVKGKVDDMVRWKHMIIGGVAVVGFLGAVAGWLVAKASDYVTIKVPANAPVIVSPTTTPSAAVPPTVRASSAQ